MSANGQSIGDLILAARDRADAAEQEFREVVRAAMDRGASTRKIADLLGWSHSMVWRWTVEGRPRTRAAGESIMEPAWRSVILDLPAEELSQGSST